MCSVCFADGGDCVQANHWGASFHKSWVTTLHQMSNDFGIFGNFISECSNSRGKECVLAGVIRAKLTLGQFDNSVVTQRKVFNLK